MRFSKLRLTGFKSFVDPTDLLIQDGLTGVVGPNGCGKSNLLEALRWVMGENRPTAMRGGGMEDVIFAGASSRPARNFAEVTLTIDNSDRLAPAGFNDQDQLEIVRRITRDEEGSQTVEAVLWLPVFVMFLSLVIDVSMVFNRQSEFNRIVQDANRSYATGRLGSEDAAEAFIKTALGNFGASATVTTSLIDGIIFTRLTVPVTDVSSISSPSPRIR